METGTLWARVKAQTKAALACGALQPIATQCEWVEQAGIQFLVRIVANLVRKDEAQRQQEQIKATTGKDFNPFLPYDPNLFVADLSATHVCLLNKFNVIDDHLLIVTRAFEDQDRLLTLADFQALWVGLAEIDGLAFYNGGKTAGASQRHKHLQLVPLPLSLEGPSLPIQPTLAAATFQEGVGKIPNWPFWHAIAALDLEGQAPEAAAIASFNAYCRLLEVTGLQPTEAGNPGQPAGAYNLLMTRAWMLLVPRSQESFQSISVNSLGFAGALLVRNADQLQWLKQQGPITLLQQVACPWPEG